MRVRPIISKLEEENEFNRKVKDMADIVQRMDLRLSVRSSQV